MEEIEKDALISDLFFHLAPMIDSYGSGIFSRRHISIISGKFSLALKECGIDKKPADLRIDFFNRL